MSDDERYYRRQAKFAQLHADRAISALVGQTLGDRKVNAERARPKD